MAGYRQFARALGQPDPRRQTTPVPHGDPGVLDDSKGALFPNHQPDASPTPEDRSQVGGRQP